MNGSKMTTQRKEILAAVEKAPPSGDYVWDGKDDDERPLTREEMQKGVEAYRKKRGRPVSTARKEQVSVRYSPEVLTYFRSTGEGWQTRMDAALQLLGKRRLIRHPRVGGDPVPLFNRVSARAETTKPNKSVFP